MTSAIDPSPSRRGPPQPAFLRALIEHRALVAQLAGRQFQQQTRGTALGLAWWLLSPLLLLLAYTFVFAFVLKLRWNTGDDGGAAEYAMRLFCALAIYQIVADAIAISPSLISTNTQYVKQIVFPVDILPAVTVAVSSIAWVFSFVVLLLMVSLLEGVPALTTLLVPIAMIPVVLLGLGVGWIFGALGVFLPDLRNMSHVLLPMLMFLSPIFYPIDRLESYVPFVEYIHPLAAVMEQVRACVFDPTAINPVVWLVALASSLAIAWGGHAFFSMLRPLFADVL